MTAATADYLAFVAAAGPIKLVGDSMVRFDGPDPVDPAEEDLATVCAEAVAAATFEMTSLLLTHRGLRRLLLFLIMVRLTWPRKVGPGVLLTTLLILLGQPLVNEILALLVVPCFADVAKDDGDADAAADGSHHHRGLQVTTFPG